MDKPTLKVVPFTGKSRLPVECDSVLEALKGQLSYVLVIGWGTDEEGNPLVAASSSSDLREAFFIMDQYKHAACHSRFEGEGNE